MVLPLLVLTGGTLLPWVAVLCFAEDSARTAATLGLSVTLPPAAMTLLAVVKVCRRWPDAGPMIVMAGTFFRMAVAVGCVAVMQDRAKELGTTSAALTQWTTGFYLLTLALETGLLWGLLDRPVREPTHEPPADQLRR